MNKKELQALSQRAAKSIKTDRDLCDFSAILGKITVEAALNAEFDEHLGYERHQPTDNTKSRNGYSSKILLTEDGTLDGGVPRGRDGSFEPQIIRKHQTQLTVMDDKIQCLYAKGVGMGLIMV